MAKKGLEKVTKERSENPAEVPAGAPSIPTGEKTSKNVAEKIDPAKAFQLSMQGKIFNKTNPEGNLQIPGEKGPISISFDMLGNRFTIGGKEYKAKLPMGAQIEEVRFEQSGVKITGSLLFASQEKSVSYEDFSKAFRELNNSTADETKVNLGGSEITFLTQNASTKKPQQKVELAEAN